MFEKEITFIDYKGNTRTETFNFNLSKSEALKMELGTNGGLTAKINKIIAAQDVPEIMEVFEDLIRKSYGVISDDGREFIKSDELTNKFMQTEAYNNFFFELCTVDGKASEFVNGIVPKVDNKGLSKIEKG